MWLSYVAKTYSSLWMFCRCHIVSGCSRPRPISAKLVIVLHFGSCSPSHRQSHHTSGGLVSTQTFVLDLLQIAGALYGFVVVIELFRKEVHQLINTYLILTNSLIP